MKMKNKIIELKEKFLGGNVKMEKVKKVFGSDEEEAPKETTEEESVELLGSEAEPETVEEEVIEEFDDDETLPDEHPLKEMPEALPTEEEVLLQFNSTVRRLNDAEQQLSQRRIWWKSETNMTGLMTANEILDLADGLKMQLKNLGKSLITDYDYEDAAVNDKINEISSGLKTYEYWTVKQRLKKATEE